MKKEVLTPEGKKLFPFFKSFRRFYLAGGTGLALQIGHRISADFDFFNDSYIPKNFIKKVEKEFSGMNVYPSVNDPEELTVFINDLKVTFLRYPFPLIENLVEYKKIGLMSAGEIAATKAYTIGRRGSYKDYVDLYFCLKEDFTCLEEIIGICEKKYGEKFNSRLFLEQLIYLEDLEDIDIIFLKERLEKKEIVRFFEKKIKEIDI